MAADTKIEWTDATWNPVRGCSRVSEGCRNCYAEKVAARFSGPGLAYEGLARWHERSDGDREARWTGKMVLIRDQLHLPLRWRQPKRIFVNSMSDLFHENLTDGQIMDVWRVMGLAHRHTFQVLTKRPERMSEVLSGRGFDVLPNVWLGTSVEDHKVIGRIDELRTVPAAIRFVSFEPLIGSVGRVTLSGVHWAIVGGESGPGARAIEPRWVDEIEAACRRYDAAFFFKQWGGVQKKRTGRIYREREWDELPTAGTIA